MDRNSYTKAQINSTLVELNRYADLLYSAPCIFVKNMVLNQIRCKLSELVRLNEMTDNIRIDLTLEQLSQYNGKNGNSAYVAVNGIVYDVTDNAAWAAATHFGLTAGRDLTGPFNSCHAGQEILSRLKAVGSVV